MRAIPRWVRGVFICVAALAAPAAQAWPDRPVRIVVPASAGTAPDAGARLIGERMAAALKQPVIVDNRPGAGGVVAMNHVASSRDDHTLLLVITSTIAIAPLTIKAAASFDYLRDLKPVVRLAQTPLMIVANNDATGGLGAALDRARREPGKVAFGTPPASTMGALAVSWIGRSAGVQFNAVPFVRPSEALAAVVSGDLQYHIDGISVALPFVRAGKVKAVAVLSDKKLQGLEAYPLGVDTLAGFEMVGRFGLMGTRELPTEAIASIQDAVQDALSHPDVVAKLTNLGLYPDFATADAYEEGLKDEREFWRGVVTTTGVSPD
ncbi:tripartite tricarboxylate transporter substrate binding protein [Bordetella genomosp. 13]|uniref:tripartite tricarboxylate transporter substrate binding protein n=1 Tax=Bordetella genomosp. 13 TaxID=463040 RepID=UPI0011A96AB0|nr:tripartite tricarboxylate transporter substrate binding protein [Bordetella genomosp. 13]